jgi:glycosyltransferase involved in cell wall biosynthesis
MKKLLYITNISIGVSSFSVAAVRAAEELGVEFHLAGNFDGTTKESLRKNEKEYGVKLHQIDFIRTPYDLRNIKAYKQLVQLIKREKFDAIHCNTPTGGVLGRLAGKKCKVRKIIYQAHGFHFYKGAPKKNWLIYYPIEKWLAKYTDALITINNEDYELAKSKFQLRHNGKVYYVPGVGIDLSQYDLPDGVREKKRKELGLKETDIVLISSGELNENKNNQIIIQALSKLRHENLHYIICGTGSKYDELKKMTSDNGLDDYIHFLGYRNDIKELYRASDIFVMPSLREGLSRSIMEAMASGLPCVVSNIRGNTDLLENTNSGFLCEATDVLAYTKKIKKLANDETVRKTMGKNSLVAIQKFNMETVEIAVSKVYKSELNDITSI